MRTQVLIWASVALVVTLTLLITVSVRASRARKALRAQYANQPWMWRDDWASGVLRETRAASATAVWVMGILWLIASIFVFVKLTPDLERRGKPVVLAALFPLSAVAMCTYAAYLSMRERRYGTSTLRLDRIPLAPGSTFHGEITSRLPELPVAGVAMRLKNIHRKVVSTGKSTHVHEKVLWSDEHTVSPGAIARAADGARIPFSFTIPTDTKPTDITNDSDSIIWRLEVRADVPGIDYAANFELPVF